MDFKKMSLKSILFVSLAAFFLIGFVAMRFFSKTDLPALENNEIQNPVQRGLVKETTLENSIQNPLAVPPTGKEEDAAIQEQLDRDRKQQKQTKDLRIKLEQANLELEQEKALAEINKLKKENRGTFDEPALEGQKNLPEIKVDYIGGSSLRKEAILSIGGTSYQVKERSNPTADIQVVSISDSSVTLHFSAPEELTKIIDYKPE